MDGRKRIKEEKQKWDGCKRIKEEKQKRRRKKGEDGQVSIPRKSHHINKVLK